jgi:hypothetical protein
MIHDLAERGIGIRSLADPIKFDSSNPNDPVRQLADVLLALFGQMERTYTIERAAHARAVATAKGRRIGRPILIDARLRRAPARQRTDDRRNRRQDRHPPDKPLPAPPTPPRPCAHRRRRRRDSHGPSSRADIQVFVAPDSLPSFLTGLLQPSRVRHRPDARLPPQPSVRGSAN